MRILHLVDRLRGRGGAYTHLHGVASAQVAAGHDVVVAGGDAPSSPWPCRTLAVTGLDARARAPVALDSLYRDLSPHVLHVHTVVNPSALEWAAEHGAVITVQDHRYFCPGRGKWTRAGETCRQPMARAACSACFEDEVYFERTLALTKERLSAVARMEVVVLSHYMRAELIAAGLDAARVHVVPPFVHGLGDLERGSAEPPCVLFAGRLTEAKGVRDAVEAWQRARVALPLVVAGTGPLREWTEAAGAQVQGWVDRAALARLYARAAVVVLPPRWQEPFGIVGLEALTRGVPVAAWACGGIPEWHPGDESLVGWGDVDALAGALRWCAGRRAQAPTGFERDPLMARLHAAYSAAAASPAAAACGIF